MTTDAYQWIVIAMAFALLVVWNLLLGRSVSELQDRAEERNDGE